MLSVLTISALGAASLIAAGFDLATRRIPNWLNLIILIGGLGSLLLLPDFSTAFWHLAHLALALVASMALFVLGMWGGGDAKLYAAVAVWLPVTQAPLLALATALSGLLLLIVVFFHSRAQNKPEHLRELPYGVAIACGTLATIAFNQAG